jgi:hypothetical protein
MDPSPILDPFSTLTPDATHTWSPMTVSNWCSWPRISCQSQSVMKTPHAQTKSTPMETLRFTMIVERSVMPEALSCLRPPM